MEAPQLNKEKADPASISLEHAITSNNILAAHKFMQTLDDRVYRELEKVAEERGVTVQGLIRAVIIPNWIAQQSRVEDALPHPLTMSGGNGSDSDARRTHFPSGPVLNSKTNSSR